MSENKTENNKDQIVKKMPKEDFSYSMTTDEWHELTRALEGYHSIFYRLWALGYPMFSRQIPTAAVSFNKFNDEVVFMFNPDFWKSLDFKSKCFVVSHECLHVILNHGARIKDVKNFQVANQALDIVVNHSLVNNFDFKREEIMNQEKLCWTDTIFPEIENLDTRQTFEHYFNLMKQMGKGQCSGQHSKGSGQKCDGSCGHHQETVDEHEMMEDSGDLIDKLSEEMSDEEKKDLKDFIDKHFDQKAGTGAGAWSFIPKKKVVKKRTWEAIIRQWAKRALRYADVEAEQWAHESRNHQLIKKDVYLPSDREVHDLTRLKCKIQVWLMLDTSGSTYHLKDRFFNAAKSIPTDRFEVKLINFDTQVYETTLASGKVYGGGGTSFHILEEYIQKEIREKGIKYPLCFVISDGYGDNLKPEFPKKWHWFMTDDHSKECIPKESFIHMLKDFE